MPHSNKNPAPILADDIKAIAGGALRLFAMLLLSAAVGCLILQQAVYGGDPSEAAVENSLIELLQLAFLAISMALLSVVAARRREWRSGIVLVCAFFMCMAIRECDSSFDKAFYHGAWLPFALAVAAAGVIQALARRRSTFAGLAAIVRDRSFGVLCSGLSAIFAFSRILGYKRIWLTIYRDICGEKYAIELCRAMKNFAEEGTELFGYALVFLWAASFAVASLRPPRETDGKTACGQY